MKKIAVLHCPVEGKPQFKQIEEGLNSYYEMIGCRCMDIKCFIEDYIIILDDEGRLTNKKTNPNFYPVMAQMFNFGICGDFIIAKTNDDGDTVSLNELDVMFLSDILEKESTIRPIVEKIIKAEEKYIKENPEVLAPKIIPFDFMFEEFRKR